MFDVSPYQISWVMLAAGSLMVGLAMYYWLRRQFSEFHRVFFSAMLPLFLLVPAPLPNYEGFYAPAYIVYLFEAFFQIKGEPGLSGQILLISLASFIILCLAGRYFYEAKNRE